MAVVATSSGANFTFFEPPAVRSLEPADGIFYSGTSVIVRGSGLHRQWHQLQCKFGNSSSAHYDPTPQQWYGDSVVRATYSSGAVRCVTPTSAQSGAARLLSITFAPEHSNLTSIKGVGATATLRGAATVLGSQGALRLTAAGYGETGSVAVSAADGDRPISTFAAAFSRVLAARAKSKAKFDK